MTVLIGIDPGIARTGYGVVRAGDAGDLHHLTHGTIPTDAADPVGRRLGVIHDRISELLKTYRPSMAGVECLYFARNISSAFPVAYARGVILLALHQAGVPVWEYPPQEIKQALTGNGRAAKDQVQELVRFLLGLPDPPVPDHASDALAAAICCFHSVPASDRGGLRVQ
jgi:crossover junction endodeoxyribonuclease RuvC